MTGCVGSERGWYTVLPWQELQQRCEYEFILSAADLQAEEDLSGFVICYEQRAYAYLNRCPHQQVYLNWSPHQFFDREQQTLICSTHGAVFRPEDGQCIQGPCVGQRLRALETRITAGQVQVFVRPVHRDDVLQYAD
ncbi:MAG: Rieske (2Fe-2S) protein [Thiolinea sp.]